MEELFQLIGTGGDVAMMVVAVALYRIDKRVYKLELERNNYVLKTDK